MGKKPRPPHHILYQHRVRGSYLPLNSCVHWCSKSLRPPEGASTSIDLSFLFTVFPRVVPPSLFLLTHFEAFLKFSFLFPFSLPSSLLTPDCIHTSFCFLLEEGHVYKFIYFTNLFSDDAQPHFCPMYLVLYYFD